jgi:hypothetical protein
VAIRELLLEFAGEALLDLVEAGEEGDGNEDYDGALSVADFELEAESVCCVERKGEQSVLPHEQTRFGEVVEQT